MQKNSEEPADLHVGIDVNTGGFDAQALTAHFCCFDPVYGVQ